MLDTRTPAEVYRDLVRMSFLRIPVWPWGQINVKVEPADDRKLLFSEYYRRVPAVVIFGLRFTWRRWRKC